MRGTGTEKWRFGDESRLRAPARDVRWRMRSSLASWSSDNSSVSCGNASWVRPTARRRSGARDHAGTMRSIGWIAKRTSGIPGRWSRPDCSGSDRAMKMRWWDLLREWAVSKSRITGANSQDWSLFSMCVRRGISSRSRLANSLGNGAPAATRTRDPRLRRQITCDRSFFDYVKAIDLTTYRTALLRVAPWGAALLQNHLHLRVRWNLADGTFLRRTHPAFLMDNWEQVRSALSRHVTRPHDATVVAYLQLSLWSSGRTTSFIGCFVGRSRPYLRPLVKVHVSTIGKRSWASGQAAFLKYHASQTRRFAVGHVFSTSIGLPDADGGGRSGPYVATIP